MGSIADILGGLGKSLGSPILFGGRRGGKSTMADEQTKLILKLEEERVKNEHEMLIQAQAQAQNLTNNPFSTQLGTGLAGAGLTTTTTGTGWTQQPQTSAGFQPINPDDYLMNEPEKKKKYANDIERSIDEEVRRIKNL
jgi:hypothetical protein